MSEQWYLHKEGNQYGPYSWEELTAFAREGRVEPGDNVWNSTMAAWAPAAAVAGLIPRAFVGGPQGGDAPSRVAPPSTPGGEEVLDFIPALKKKTGLFSSKTYTLVVTNRRLIFAELTNKMLDEAAAESREAYKEATKGKGWLARLRYGLGEALSSDQRIYNRYYSLTGEQILRENPANFAPNNDEVKKVRINMYRDVTHPYSKGSDEMMIQTTRGKIKLTFYGAAGGAEKTLQRTLGKKVK